MYHIRLIRRRSRREAAPLDARKNSSRSRIIAVASIRVARTCEHTSCAASYSKQAESSGVSELAVL